MEELRRIYKKRKQQILPIAVGFATFFVFFRIILPQWADIEDAQSLLTSKNESIKVREDNLLLLNSMSDSTVDNNYLLASTALPIQKDITLIFSQLNDIAGKSGVKLGTFSINVGDIYTTSKEKISSDRVIDGIPYLTTLVSVSGTVEQTHRFLDLLYESIPLVEVASVDISKSNARYDINFFFKPIVLRPTNEYESLKKLTPQQEKELENLANWKSDDVSPSGL